MEKYEKYTRHSFGCRGRNRCCWPRGNSYFVERRELFPKTIRFSASAKSAGQTIDFKGKPIAVEELTAESFKGIDVAICSAGSSVSQKWVIPEVLKKTIAIDNCSYHRMDPKVPLIVPEINQAVLSERPEKSIIANPNCTTIAMVVALGSLHQHFSNQKNRMLFVPICFRRRSKRYQ